mmetsp:Transcript_4707/g.5660  ORF Transcript_4707/g.5660 Transcript_4707/m.5660 type:complete len:206 (+) Transcript_4707:115-732(+)
MIVEMASRIVTIPIATDLILLVLLMENLLGALLHPHQHPSLPQFLLLSPLQVPAQLQTQPLVRPRPPPQCNPRTHRLNPLVHLNAPHILHVPSLVETVAQLLKTYFSIVVTNLKTIQAIRRSSLSLIQEIPMKNPLTIFPLRHTFLMSQLLMVLSKLLATKEMSCRNMTLSITKQVLYRMQICMLLAKRNFTWISIQLHQNVLKL